MYKVEDTNSKIKVLEKIYGFILSEAISAVIELGIPTVLQGKSLNAEAIAKNIGSHPLATYRLMRFLASYQFFEEDKKGRFSLTLMGEHLSSKEGSLGSLVLSINKMKYREIVGKLTESVMQGIPAFDLIYGEPFFDYIMSHPSRGALFEEHMTKLTQKEDKCIPLLIDIKSDGVIVDIGGGRGSFLREILTLNPKAKGILFEMPFVLENEDNLMLDGVRERCELISGNFFHAIPKGDIYILKRVLHDWEDIECSQILEGCRTSMNKRGKIIILESLIPEGNTRDLSKDDDILMMALCKGRERTKRELHRIIKKAKLKLFRILPTPTQLFIVEIVA